MTICRSARSHITSSKAGTPPSKRMRTTIIPFASPCWWTTDGNYYVVEVLRDRLLYHQLKAQAIAQAQKHRPNTILIEEAGLGRTLVKDLKAAGLPAVGVVPEGDKLTRVSLQVEKFENRRVFFPSEAPWLADLRRRSSLLFPTGATMTRLMLSSKAWPTSVQPFHGMRPHLRVWKISRPASCFCATWEGFSALSERPRRGFKSLKIFDSFPVPRRDIPCSNANRELARKYLNRLKISTSAISLVAADRRKFPVFPGANAGVHHRRKWR